MYESTKPDSPHEAAETIATGVVDKLKDIVDNKVSAAKDVLDKKIAAVVGATHKSS